MRLTRPPLRLPAALVAAAAALAVVAPVAALGATATTTDPRTGTAGEALLRTDPDALLAPPGFDVRPRGRRLTERQVLRIAGREEKVRRARAEHPGSYARAFLKGRDRWQASWYQRQQRGPAEEIAQVLIEDRSGRVLEAWTGPQVAWTMARGYPGAFGRKVNDPIVWIPLCVLFLLPFARRPLRLLHLDLVVLLSFSVSYALFNAGDIDASVPLVYPGLLYLTARAVWAARSHARTRAGRAAAPPPLRLLVPVSWLAIGIVFLVGFRVGLNVTNSNVIDVGYAGVIGADRLTDGEPLYGSWPRDNHRGDTYGTVAYYAYVPWELALPWSGRWDDLPAAHGAALTFDLACIALLWLLGRRLRGPTLGLLLAWCWVAYPFTLFVSNTNANDALVALTVAAAALVAAAPAARGAVLAAAALTKFAPLALLPVWALHPPGPGRRRRGGRARAAVVTLAAFAVAVAVLLAPVLASGDLDLMLERTLAFQADRGSPFSVWGLWGWPDVLQLATQLAAAALAVGLAVWPRRRDAIVLCAAGAAALLAAQLAVDHWFYTYLVWPLPLLLVALLAPAAEPDG